MKERQESRRDIFHRIGDAFTSVFKEFNAADTVFIEQQHYNYTVMLQNTNTYEMYRLATSGGQHITLAPKMGVRVGPYVGWRWVFLGYTLDVRQWGRSGDHSQKKEFDLSLYSSLIGLDLFWRETGDNYYIRRVYLGPGVNTRAAVGMPFDGFSGSIKGFNAYYITNHRRFSYPAAYSQSTRQKRSSGSPLLGLGYTRHSLHLDWEQLSHALRERLDPSHSQVNPIDTTLRQGEIRYSDVHLSAGYSYNWVPAPHWLVNASLSAALAYNQTHGNQGRNQRLSLHNFNLDGIVRLGLVWNNDHYYAGSSAILHSYNYQRDAFSTNNFFGSINVYVGVNFGRKR